MQISGQDVESKRSDKTDFAERLGAMNRRWQVLQGRINERVRTESLILERRTDTLIYLCKIRILQFHLYKILVDSVPGEPFGDVVGV